MEHCIHFEPEPDNEDVCVKCHLYLEHHDRWYYVSVYDVFQAYGGPEEGGWWYNKRGCLLSLPMTREEIQTQNVDKIIEDLSKRYVSQGNIHSTKGGKLYEILPENRAGQHEDLRNRRYE